MSILTNEKADWVKVLEIMYEEQMIEGANSENSNEDLPDILDNPSKLMKEVRIDAKEMTTTINNLEEMGFVEDTPAPLSLTQEGFQLAHQIKTEKQRRNTNIILVVLTAVLTVLTIGLLGVELAPIFMIFY